MFSLSQYIKNFKIPIVQSMYLCQQIAYYKYSTPILDMGEDFPKF